VSHPTSTLTDWSEVKPNAVYPVAALAALMGVCEATVIRWARDGRVKHLPRLSPKAPLRFLGAEMLKLLGDQQGALSGPSETTVERQARGMAAARRIAELARDRAGA
jgi:hypothetical protein